VCRQFANFEGFACYCRTNNGHNYANGHDTADDHATAYGHAAAHNTVGHATAHNVADSPP
jgi:hypothetical protein